MPDELDAVVADLDQLRTEVSSNESRPSAEEIVVRLRQQSERLRDLIRAQTAQNATLATDPMPAAAAAMQNAAQPIVDPPASDDESEYADPSLGDA